MTALEKVINALRSHGCDPQPLFDDGWWLAICPCCRNRSLIVGPASRPGGPLTVRCAQ